MNETQLLAALGTARDESNRGSGRLWTEAVECLFKKHHRNGRLPVVLGKVEVLNALYGTQLHFGNTRVKRGRAWRKTDSAEYKFARWVTSNAGRLDSMLDRGSVKAVRMLEMEHPLRTKTGKVTHLYSFATKFAHFHNPSAYPIWDSRADASVRKFARVRPFKRPLSDLNGDDWYEAWVSDLGEIKAFLGAPNYRELDKALYMWNGGKEV